MELKKGDYFISKFSVVKALEDADDCSTVNAEVLYKSSKVEKRGNDVGVVSNYFTFHITKKYKTYRECHRALNRKIFKI